MSDELKEALEDESLSEEIQTEAQQSAPEEAPAEESEKLSGYDKRIAVLTDRNYKLQQELDQFKASQKTQEVLAEQPPEVPDFPDDDLRIEEPAKYKQQLNEYNQAMHKRAVYEAEQSIQKKREAETKREQAAALQSRNQEIISQYIENGLSQEVAEDRMLANESVLKAANINKDLAQYLYSDPNGAKIVDYLARNPDQLNSLAIMSPTLAAVQVATEVKAKALATKPHVTEAPDPAVPTRGGGKPPVDEWGSLAAGATFE